MLNSGVRTSWATPATSEPMADIVCSRSRSIAACRSDGHVARQQEPGLAAAERDGQAGDVDLHLGAVLAALAPQAHVRSGGAAGWKRSALKRSSSGSPAMARSSTFRRSSSSRE